MFRKITNSAPCRQPLQRKETVVKTKLIGGTSIRKSVTFENPQHRIDFDKYSLEDLLATGVKLEQINTKVIDSVNFETVSSVSRGTSETTQSSTEEEPF